MNEPCFTDSCKQSPSLKVWRCCVSWGWISPWLFAISEMCTVRVTVCCTLLLPLPRSNGVCDFITRGLMWCGVPIFSTLLDYWDLMESQTAEFAPMALHLRWTHCGIHPLCLHKDTSPVLPPVGEKRKLTLNGLFSMNEWGNGVWSDAQDKRCLVCVSAELCPSYFHDW